VRYTAAWICSESCGSTDRRMEPRRHSSLCGQHERSGRWCSPNMV